MHLHVFARQIDARDAFERSDLIGTKIFGRLEIHTKLGVHRFIAPHSGEEVLGLEVASVAFAPDVSAAVQAAINLRLRR